MLAVFEFCKAKDGHGGAIEVPLNCTGNFFLHAAQFECDIHPRDEKATELLASLSAEG